MESKVTHRNLAKHSHELLMNLSQRDSLTQLKNRRAFMNDLSRAQASLDRGKITYKLMYLDLDNFKAINDDDPTHHNTGDKVLIIVARTLEEMVRVTDTVARLGGDEFGVLLSGYDPAENNKIIKIFRERFKSNFLKNAGEIIKKSPIVGHLDVSFGIIEPKKGDDIYMIMQRADDQMYISKKSKLVNHE